MQHRETLMQQHRLKRAIDQSAGVCKRLCTIYADAVRCNIVPGSIIRFAIVLQLLQHAATQSGRAMPRQAALPRPTPAPRMSLIAALIAFACCAPRPLRHFDVAVECCG